MDRKSVLCIDIGIRNLAMCIMSYSDKDDLQTYSIDLWGVFDTMERDSVRECKGILKNKKICNKKAGYKNGEEFFCKTHFPKEIKITKKNTLKKKKIVDYLLQDLVKVFLEKFTLIYNENEEIFKKVQEIYLELQPKCNPKMKMISHILFGKIVELYSRETKIRFISAVKKLKIYKGPALESNLKSKYSHRKWLSIQYTRWFLENKFNDEEREKWMSFLNNQGKSDDICDCFCYCIHVIS